MVLPIKKHLVKATLMLLIISCPAIAAINKTEKLKFEIERLKTTRDNTEAAFWNQQKKFIEQKKNNANQLKQLDYTIQDFETKRNLIREDCLKSYRKTGEIQQDVEKLKLEIEAINNTLLEIIKELHTLYKFNQPLMPITIQGELEKLRNLITKKPNYFTHHAGQLFQIISTILNEGSIAKLQSKQMITANNKLRNVWQLRVGNIFFAYITKDFKKAGILLHGKGTGGATFRWHEKLPSTFRKALKNSVLQLLNKKSKKNYIHLPMDVLLSKAVGTRYSEESPSLWKQITNLVQSGGPIMIPLFAIAFLAIGIIFERILFYKNNHTKSELIMDIIFPKLENFNKSSISEIKISLNKFRGPLKRMLFNLFNSTPSSREEAHNLLEENMLHEIPLYEKRLATLKVLGAVAPLLGLLGTVSGMISLFDVITVYGTKDPRLMAGGISEALLTTETGLIIAIPIVLCHRFLLNKVNTIVYDMEHYGLAVLNRMWKDTSS